MTSRSIKEQAEVEVISSLYDGDKPLHPTHKRNYDEDPQALVRSIEALIRALKDNKDQQNDIPASLILEAERYLPFVKQLKTVSRNKEDGGYTFTTIQIKTAEELRRVENALKSFFVSDTMFFIVSSMRDTPEDKATTKKYFRAGHFTDMLLVPKKYLRNGYQPELFDMLDPVVKNKIISSGVSREAVNRKGVGIRLTAGEYRVIDSIWELLQEKSENSTNKDLENFFMGNQEPEIVKYSGRNAIAPKLVVTLYEITKKYKGGEKVSGQDQKNVLKILQDLSDNPEKKFLIKYQRVSRDSVRKIKITDEISDFQNIIKIYQGKRKMEDEETGEHISTRQELFIQLNPIFRDQIDSKFYRYIPNINERMLDAMVRAGITQPSNIPYALREYLVRELSSKNKTTEYGLYEKFDGSPGLLWLICPTYMESSRNKKALEWFHKAAEVCKNIGLLNGYEVKTGKNGKPMVKFEINRDWV